MVRIGIASNYGSLAPDARCWAITSHLGIAGSAVNFLKHRVINVGSERIFHGVHVHMMAVRCELHTISNPHCHVLHECRSCSGSAIPERIGDDQLRVRINRNPCPAIASASSHLLGGHVLLLCIDETPRFIALNAAYAEIADTGIMVGSTCATHVL